jgi:hypothetical protein
MDIHRPALDDVKSVRRIAFVKEIIAFGQRLHHRDVRNFGKVRRRQPGEKLAVPERIDDGGLLEFCQWGGHGIIRR